jgi:hypothetical protein
VPASRSFTHLSALPYLANLALLTAGPSTHLGLGLVLTSSSRPFAAYFPAPCVFFIPSFLFSLCSSYSCLPSNQTLHCRTTVRDYKFCISPSFASSCVVDTAVTLLAAPPPPPPPSPPANPRTRNPSPSIASASQAPSLPAGFFASNRDSTRYRSPCLASWSLRSRLVCALSLSLPP